MKNNLLLLLIFAVSANTYAQNYITNYGTNNNTVPAGTYHTLFGYIAGHSMTSSSTMNTGSGFSSLYYTTTGSYNSAVGAYALYNNVTGSGNVADGYRSLFQNQGSYNTAVGYQSATNTQGSNNTAVGYQALINNNSGTNNTAIGFGADVNNPSLTNVTAIGYGAIAKISNTIQLGNAAVTDVYVGNNAVLNAGGLRIGTTTLGSFKLAVEGKIGAREVQVTAANPWPDYVFEKDYKLPSLQDVKTYIDQNKHLPEVPSAKEIEKNGLQLGEMNAILLKKVEELTLHLIQTNQRLDKLEQENAELMKKSK
jgi:hypothetical protein